MIRSALAAPLLLSLGAFGAEVPFTVKTGLYNQADSVDLGLSKATGTETITVFQPTAANDHYANGVVVIGFKGSLYCMWQSSAIHEDSTDTWVAYSRSTDGKTWSAPAKIAGPGSADYKTSGGWWVNGDTLVAYVNVWPTTLSPRGGNAYYATSLDGLSWSALKPVIMADGKAMAGILEQDSRVISGGRIVGAAHFQPGLLVSPIYTDDPSGVRGWKKATYTNLAVSSNVSREIEPSLYRRADSALVMVFRDQNTTYIKLASISTDRGATWSATVETNMPDSRAKQSAGNLPDGTAYQVSNPVVTKRRSPLVVTLSKDGRIFDKAYALRTGGSDLQAQRWSGKAKTLGYSYPKSTVWNGYLYSAYATNKEDVQISRVPLSSLQMNSTSVDRRSTSSVAARAFVDRLVVEGVGEIRCQVLSVDGRLLEEVAGTNRVVLGASLRIGTYILRVRDPGGIETALVTKFR